MEPLLQRLARGEILVGDGAWGTELMARGLEAGQCPESFNLGRPDVLAEIAVSYLDAGAQFVTTNTFGGSPLKLRSYGLEDRTEAINRRAVEVLREVAGDRAYVWGSVGPTGKMMKPYGNLEEDHVYESFERQIRALAEAGADVICVETMIDLREASLAVRAAKTAAPAIPVMATMTFDPTPRGFFTVMGTDIEGAVKGLELGGADVVGSNCGNGIETMVEIARELNRHAERPIAIQSNAGLPERREGEIVYPESPAFMAQRVPDLIGLGVAVLGGCCGTTPEHIDAIRRGADRLRKAE
jgi:5-methyltetrahydrofolate--homocysteine methyltransferase